MKATHAMEKGHKATPEQRKRAVLTAAVLALVAVGIYATVVLGFLR